MKQIFAWSILLVLGQFNSALRAQSQDAIAKQFAGLWCLIGAGRNSACEWRLLQRARLALLLL